MNKLALSMFMTLVGFSTISFANGGDYTSCSIEVAVATPPVKLDEHVAFNITAERGTSNSVTLNGGSLPKTISNLICSSMPYDVTATIYSIATAIPQPGGIGICTLKKGPIVLLEPNNSASVVFPQDFICNWS